MFDSARGTNMSLIHSLLFEVRRSRPVGSSAIGRVSVSVARMFQEPRVLEGRTRFRVCNFWPVVTERRLQSSRTPEVVGELQVDIVLGFAFDIDGDRFSPTLARVKEVVPRDNLTSWAYKQGQFRKKWNRRCAGGVDVGEGQGQGQGQGEGEREGEREGGCVCARWLGLFAAVCGSA